MNNYTDYALIAFTIRYVQSCGRAVVLISDVLTAYDRHLASLNRWYGGDYQKQFAGIHPETGQIQWRWINYSPMPLSSFKYSNV